jgi:NADP-dependent 3-hydroxy acid dehydrogenase YdfG
MLPDIQTLPAGFDFQPVAGKTVLITGGATGIGRATAVLLASQGARVMIFGRRERELNNALESIRRTRNDVAGLTADVSQPNEVRRVFAQADTHFGRLDVLINNAALWAGDVFSAEYEKMQYIVKTNLLGYMGCAHEAVRRMRETGGGHIVNIGSMSADVREAGSSVYVATSAGIQGFSEALRKEVNPLGIKVSLIEPGAVGTNMQPGTPDEQLGKIAEAQMLMAEDVALAVLFCLVQPRRSDVVSVQIRPHLQPI